MNYYLIFGVGIAFILYLLIFRNKNKFLGDTSVIDEEQFEDLNDKFCNNYNHRVSIDFVRVFNPSDTMLLRSLFDSKNIESYLKFGGMNNLYPGIQIVGHTSSIICVYEDKLEEAKIVVDEFKLAIKRANPEKPTSKIRNIVEFALAGQSVPSGRNKRLPEVLV